MTYNLKKKEKLLWYKSKLEKIQRIIFSKTGLTWEECYFFLWTSCCVVVHAASTRGSKLVVFITNGNFTAAPVFNCLRVSPPPFGSGLWRKWIPLLLLRSRFWLKHPHIYHSDHCGNYVRTKPERGNKEGGQRTQPWRVPLEEKLMKPLLPTWPLCH